MTDSDREVGRSSFSRWGFDFFVIVASILAAFALDAWWNGRIEERQIHAQLQTIRGEFVSIRSELQDESDRLERVRVAVANVLPQISPTAEVLSLDSIAVLMDVSFRHSTIELQSGSLQALLASGQLASVDYPELPALLATWPAAAASLRTQSQMLENNREMIIEYLHDRIPTLQIAEKTGQMEPYPESDFTASAQVVQRDMKVEGLFGNRGMMIEDTDVLVQDLYSRAGRIIDLMDSILSG